MIYELKELVDYVKITVDPNILKKTISRLGPNRKVLYDYLSSNKEVDDAAPCYLLYAKESTNAYVKLKVRLYQNLLDLVLFSTNVNIDADMAFDMVRDRCVRNLAIIRLLSTKQLFANLEYLCKRTLQSCERYELYDIAADILKVLLNYYGSFLRDQKKFSHYLIKYEKYKRIKDEEDHVQISFYNFFNKQQSLAKSTKDELYTLFAIDKLQSIVDSPDQSFKTVYFSYNSICLYCDLVKDYEGLRIWADRVAFYVRKKHPKNIRMYQNMLNLRLLAELKLKRYEEIKDTLRELNGLIQKDSLEYYIVNIYTLLMNVHLKNYNDAIDIVSRVNRGKRKTKFSAELVEYLNICHAYMVFVNQVKQIDLAAFPKFRIFRFLNNVPAYQADKRGVNISILVLHILFLVEKRKYTQIIDRVDALKQYAYRYLRKDDSFRSNCFIKMIIEMTKADFNPIRTKRYTSELLKKLRSVPLELSEQPLEVEIVPYEDLWEMVMELLERNNRRTRSI